MTDQRNYTSENAELVESKWLVKYPKFNYMLTRARLAVWIFRDILGGGESPLLTRLLGIVARNGKCVG